MAKDQKVPLSEIIETLNERSPPASPEEDNCFSNRFTRYIYDPEFQNAALPILANQFSKQYAVID
jgi:hypothetical protein